MIRVNCSDYCDGNGLCVKNTRTTDAELTRLKRQVEVLREGLKEIAEGKHFGQGYIKAYTTLAAADRIAKEQPHDKD